MLHLDKLDSMSAQVIISLAIILIAGFLMTRITKKLRLPNVTGYIISGVLIGPYVLNLIPEIIVERMDFVTDAALAFIAFGVGKYFKLSQLRKSGAKIFIITAFEALTAALLITLVMIFVFHLSVPFALLLGAIGSATAPASTIMTIRQYKAKGEFVNTILQVVALDDAVALLAFSICAAVAQAMESQGRMDITVVLVPILVNMAAIGLGVGGGFLLNKLINEHRSQDHRLVLVIAIIFCLTGFCSAFNVSPLLSCMVLGTVYINVSGNKALFKQVNNFTPPLLLLFFVLSGMRMNVPALATAGVIGIAYFFVRILGKYAGAYIGARVSGASMEIRRFLGLALVPQAGVSIGLAVLGQRILPYESGVLLSTIILSSGVLYEMVGPACAKLSLFLSHTVQRPAKKDSPPALSVPAPDPEPADSGDGDKKKKKNAKGKKVADKEKSKKTKNKTSAVTG